MDFNIKLLRMALASIWTELEKDNPNLEHCQFIADDALNMTVDTSKGKYVSNENGLEGWLEFKEKYRYISNRGVNGL